MLVTSKGKAESTQELVNASIQVLIDALESGHSEVLTSYLKAMAKFHHYSFGNILLIATQKPNATHVAGIRSWNLLGRRVRRGEKGIMIFAPMLGRTRKESQQADAKGVESQDSVSLVGFRPVYVWDRLSRDLRVSFCALDVIRECHLEVPSIAASTSSLNSSALCNAP